MAMAFQSVLRETRLGGKISLLQVAARMTALGSRITAPQISRIELGKQTPTAVQAAAFARAVGLDPMPVLAALAGLDLAECPAPSDFAAARRHQLATSPRRARSIAVRIEVDRDGSAVVERVISGAGPAADGSPIDRIPIIDRAAAGADPFAPSLRVLSGPPGLDFEVAQEPADGGGVAYWLVLPRGWSRYSPDEGFTVQVTTRIPGLFNPDPKEALAFHGQHLTWFVDRFTLALRFACGWRPNAEAVAWAGRARITDRNDLMRASDAAKILDVDGAVELVVERPLAWFTYALQWPAVRHAHDREGTCVLG